MELEKIKCAQWPLFMNNQGIRGPNGIQDKINLDQKLKYSQIRTSHV